MNIMSMLNARGVAMDSFTVGNYGAERAPSSLPISRKMSRGVKIKADSSNPDIIYVGTAGVSLTTGFELSAGEELFLALDDPSKIYVSSDPSLNQKQLLTYNSGAFGETFKLTFDGQTTTAIAYDALASTVDSVLEALSTIASGDVAVTGSAGGPWTVEFTGNLSKETHDFLVASAVGTNEVQTVTH